MKKKNITLSIPTPCNENWENMTPNERGRHCGSCNKTVVDFSLFTDKQLVEFFSKITGAVCGRLNNMQVERELVYVEPRNSFLYKLLFGTTIALGLAGSANANYNPNILPLAEQQYPQPAENKNLDSEIAGDTIKQVSGTVLDSKDNSPLPFAAVVLLYKGTIVETGTTDIDGNFYFKNFDPASPEDLLIKIAYVGYKDKEIKRVAAKMVIKLDVSELHFISVGAIIYTPSAIDQTGHINTRIHKGDTPYW